ncbi:MAG TPA: CoA-transferase [Thermodesulfobacteriota bacterium]|nr:CoA-transferase [Thermodesulfobacteriota bacterium]
MATYPISNKVVSLEDAVFLVRDGDKVALGGALSLREPMALIREVIRQDKHNLHIIGNAHGIDVDMLCGSGCVGVAEVTYVGFEFDFGIALNYRRVCESGKVKVLESNCVTLINQLRASAFGLPFVAQRSFGGTDILKLHPEFKEIDSPFDGEKVILAPSLKPDVALIHAQFADTLGNVRIEEPLTSDIILARASEKVIISAEKVVSPEEMRSLKPTIPYFEVTAVVEVPYGAHPTNCYPNYAYDREHMAEYVKATEKGLEEFKKEYLNKYVYDVSQEEYIRLIGGKEKMKKLEGWGRSVSAWKEIFSVGEMA